MNSKGRHTGAIIGCVTSLVLAAVAWEYATFALVGSTSGTLQNHLTLVWTGVFIGSAAGFLLAGLVGAPTLRAVVAAVVVAIVAIPVVQVVTFGSITVDRDVRVAVCEENLSYYSDDRVTQLADTENISFGIDELSSSECAKNRNKLSLTGELPQEITVAQVKNLARSIPSSEKCTNKYGAKWLRGDNTFRYNGVEAYCAELSAAGDLRADGSIIGKFDKRRVDELTDLAFERAGI